MVQLTAFLIVLAVIILIMLIPVGVVADYGNEGLKLSFKAGFIRISPDFSKKKPKNDSKPKKKSKLDFSLDEWVQTVKLALKTVGRLGRKIVFERIRILFVSSAPDPYDTAMRYNAVSAALHTLVPLFEQKFTVRSRNIELFTDFDSEKSILEFGFTMTLRIGQILLLAFSAGASFLKIYLNRKRNLKYERMASHG